MDKIMIDFKTQQINIFNRQQNFLNVIRNKTANYSQKEIKFLNCNMYNV